MIAAYKAPANEPCILCNYGVLTTGFDAPQTSAAIIARPTKSLVLYSQMVGRAMRGPRVSGNASAEIVTVVDANLPGFGVGVSIMRANRELELDQSWTIQYDPVERWWGVEVEFPL